MNIIKQLWYGNIDPLNDANFNTEEVKELSKLMAQQSAELNDSLTERQRELLEDLQNSRSEQEGLIEATAFEYGFRLGAKMILDAMKD